ncbi:MAG: O-antigen ligase family protein [Bacteroidota bacterium]
MIILIAFKKLQISKGLLACYSYLIISGILSVVLGTNHLKNVFAQVFGIMICSIYFYNFYTYYNFKVVQIFKTYVYLSFGLAVIGYPLLIYNKLFGDGFLLHSILNEPAHYATFVLPSFYYAFKDRQIPRYIWPVIFGSILLSGSSLAIMGLMVAIVLMQNKIRPLRLILPVIISLVFVIILYNLYPDFKLRVDDTTKVLQNKDLSGANLSTYALLSNMYVSAESFSNNPMLGSGLGSHELSHDKYLGVIDGIEEFEEYLNLNSKDAGSLFLRVLSDMGLIGIFAIVLFIIKYRVHMNSQNLQSTFISRAIIIYFFCKLFREGHYFSPEMYFFVLGYYFVKKYSEIQTELIIKHEQ